MERRKIAWRSTQAYYEGLDASTKATAMAVGKLMAKAAPPLTETLCMGVPALGGQRLCALHRGRYAPGEAWVPQGGQDKDTTGLVEGTGRGRGT